MLCKIFMLLIWNIYQTFPDFRNGKLFSFVNFILPIIKINTKLKFN